MREYARPRGLRRLLIPVPVLTPRLSSLWLGFVTPVYARISRKPIESLRLEPVQAVREPTRADEVPRPRVRIRVPHGAGGLKPRDLIPFIGSRTKVAEVLSGKRPITMPMARALHEHLGIPVEMLLLQSENTPDTLPGVALRSS